jgi:hypothetical protein
MDLDSVTLETLEAIKKAQTSGFTSATGVVGYDLADLVSLIPVNTPFRDQLPRVKPKMGAKIANWRALLNANNAQPNPATAFDVAAALSLISEMDVSAPYAKVAAGWTATLDAEAFARGYADVHAKAIWNAMNQFKIGEDRKAIGGCAFALGTPATPVVTSSTTGGSIGQTIAIPVKVAARTGSNYFWGGSTIASASGTVTTPTDALTTHSGTATVTAVRGAVAYDWFVNGFYYTTTTVNKVVVTSIPVANALVVPNLPGLFSTVPPIVPVADTSPGVNDFNGILASLAGDYAVSPSTGLITPGGAGTPSGAYFASLNGAAFTIAGVNVVELDAMNQALYDSVQQSPDVYMVSSQEGAKLSNVLLNSTASQTFFQPNLAGRSAAVIGAFVGWYVNKAAGGTPIAIEVNPNLPPGTLIARTDSVMFPDSGIGRVTELRTQQDVTNWDYPAARAAGVGGGPRFDGEVFALETFVNFAPTTMGVLQNIG